MVAEAGSTNLVVLDPVAGVRLNLVDMGSGSVQFTAQVTNAKQALDPRGQLQLVDRLGQKVVRATLHAALDVAQ